MQHCIIDIDDFIHETWIISQSCTHMQSLCMIERSNKSRNTLTRTLVQDPNMEQIGKIMKRVVGSMIQLWIYKTSKMMKID